MSGEVSKPGLGKRLGQVAMIIVGLFVALVILGAIVGGDDKGTPVPATVSSDDQAAPAAVEPAAIEEPVSRLTGPQQNAARSANQYLSFSGFSHDGLVQQLSSDAGDGYAEADATAAVDSLDVDWNEQAARSAKQYVSMTGFSCKGLIQQLSSSAGDKYTKSQATYGAQQAGAC